MKFIVDECIARSIFNWLKEHFDAIHVQDIMPSASDDEVLGLACKENRIILTRDKDFGDLVFRDKNQHVGIILLRLKSSLPASQLLVLKKVIDEYLDQIEDNFVIATDDSIKVIKSILN